MIASNYNLKTEAPRSRPTKSFELQLEDGGSSFTPYEELSLEGLREVISFGLSAEEQLAAGAAQQEAVVEKERKDELYFEWHEVASFGSSAEERLAAGRQLAAGLLAEQRVAAEMRAAPKQQEDVVEKERKDDHG